MALNPFLTVISNGLSQTSMLTAEFSILIAFRLAGSELPSPFNLWRLSAALVRAINLEIEPVFQVIHADVSMLSNLLAMSTLYFSILAQQLKMLW